MVIRVIHFSQPCITNVFVSEVIIYLIIPLIKSRRASDFILGFLNIREIIVDKAIDYVIAMIVCKLKIIVWPRRKPICIALLHAE